VGFFSLHFTRKKIEFNGLRKYFREGDKGALNGGLRRQYRNCEQENIYVDYFKKKKVE
jgi:hypothetical protein